MNGPARSYYPLDPINPVISLVVYRIDPTFQLNSAGTDEGKAIVGFNGTEYFNLKTRASIFREVRARVFESAAWSKQQLSSKVLPEMRLRGWISLVFDLKGRAFQGSERIQPFGIHPYYIEMSENTEMSEKDSEESPRVSSNPFIVFVFEDFSGREIMAVCEVPHTSEEIDEFAYEALAVMRALPPISQDFLDSHEYVFGYAAGFCLTSHFALFIKNSLKGITELIRLGENPDFRKGFALGLCFGLLYRWSFQWLPGI